MSRLAKRDGVAAVPLIAIIAVLFCFSTASAQWENRGDLNLNGLPFELDDAAIYANYFAAGIYAFTIDPEPQIAATDINMDGICLSVADYVMMIRIEMGAGDPPPVDPDTFTTNIIYQYTDTSVIVLAHFGSAPASMYLGFDFASPPVYTARLLRSDGSISMGTANEGQAVAILITGMNDLPLGNYIPLVELAYQGDGPTSINGGVLGAAGNQGNLAVDTTLRIGDANDDGQINIGDAVFIVTWIFRGGFVPPHMQAVDVNCDDSYNVGDAIYIVNFVFRGGPAPCGTTTGGLVSHSDCLVMEKNGGDGNLSAAQDCLEYIYDGQGTLLLKHANAGLNCCPDNFAAVVSVENGIITVDETPIAENCDCLCLFDLDYQIVYVPSGTYQIVVLEQCLVGSDLPLQFTVDLAISPSGSFCLERDHYPW